MKRNNIVEPGLDLDALRTFILGMDLGSYQAASIKLGRSQAALSAQLKKLEEQVGTPLLCKAGRKLALTGAGEILMDRGRRLLELSEEAKAAAVGAADIDGWVKFGLPQDFAEGWLPQVLGRFRRLHPQVRLEVRAERSSVLIEDMEKGRLDFVIVWGKPDTTDSQSLAKLALEWVGPADGPMPWRPGQPLPLVMGEAMSPFRTATVEALDRAGMPWRIAFTSPSPSGLWSGVAAGLGVSVRTRFALPRTVRVLNPADFGLPPLPQIELSLRTSRAAPSRAAGRLATVLQDALAESLAPVRRLTPANLVAVR
jgi:DNA-binding transcriptional LysR family regulator